MWWVFLGPRPRLRPFGQSSCRSGLSVVSWPLHLGCCQIAFHLNVSVSWGCISETLYLEVSPQGDFIWSVLTLEKYLQPVKRCYCAMQALGFTYIDWLAVLWLHFTEIALILKYSLSTKKHRQNAFTNAFLIHGGGCFAATIRSLISGVVKLVDIQ